MCWYINYNCNKCHKSGHLAKICNKNISFALNKLITVVSDSDTEIGEVLVIQGSRKKGPIPKIMVNVQIHDKEVAMELDTGSKYSSMSKKYFKILKLNLPIKICNVILQTYDRTQIAVLGYDTVNVCYKNQELFGDIYIIQHDLDTILGRSWLDNLVTS